jgi:hypothetical protein
MGKFSSFSDFPDTVEEEVLDTPYIPYVEVDSIDIEKEMLAQYNRAQRLLHDASFDNEIPLNQKTQAITAATSILSQLTKSQADLYSSERFKKIENVLLETLKKFPEMQEVFMEAYEEALS